MMFRRYDVLLTLLAASTAFGAPKEPPAPPTPPMAQPQSFSIYRGRSTEISLRAVGRAPSQLRFIIRTKPQHGQLGEIRFTGPKSAVVTYSHDETAGAGGDSFTFAVQAADTAVSAPAQVLIAISEEPPALSVIHALDFGHLLLGQTREEEITLRNTGGGLLKGIIQAPEPWKIAGSPEYQLGRKKEKKVRVLFEPLEAGEYNSKLAFSHDARSSVSLIGQAASPLDFEPAQELELTAEPTGSMRSGTLVLTNRTPDERSVELSVPPEIVAPAEISIPGHGKISLALRTREDFLGSLEGKMELESEGFHRSMTLRVFALQPVLRVEPGEGLDFAEIQPGHRYKGKIQIKNEGGVGAHLKVITPGEILLLPDPNSTVLAPGEKRTFEVAFEVNKSGDYHGQIEVGTQGAPAVKIPVTARCTAAKTGAAKIPTSILAPVVAEPEENGPAQAASYNNIPPIKEIMIDSLNKRNLQISWEKPAAEATGYLIEQRQLEIAKSGPPKIIWQERRQINVLEENGRGIARIANLAPGQTWFFRIFSLNQAGLRSLPSPTIRIATPPAQKNGMMWGVTLLVLIGIVVWLFKLIRQRRQALAASDAERIARLGKS